MVGISFKSCEDSVASLVRLDSALFGAGLALLGKPPLASVSVPRVFDLSTCRLVWQLAGTALGTLPAWNLRL